MTALVDRFWSKVDRSGECWVWTRRKNADGYGTFKAHGKEVRAHRFSWSIINGGIPMGLLILHHCDNPSCVRPDHLYAGTTQQNEQDKASRGRFRNRYTSESKKGLNAEIVVKIRQDPRNNYTVAKEYGVSESTIRHARSRHTWSNVP